MNDLRSTLIFLVSLKNFSAHETFFTDLAMASDVTSVQAPNTDTEGTLSEELLFSLVNEAKAVNEVEIQKRMQQCRRRSAAVEMKALKENGNSLELSDEELLKAFAEIEDQPS